MVKIRYIAPIALVTAVLVAIVLLPSQGNNRYPPIQYASSTTPKVPVENTRGAGVVPSYAPLPSASGAPVNLHSKNSVSVGMMPTENAQKALEKARENVEKIGAEVFSRPADFYEQARRGREGVAVAAFEAVVNDSGKWKEFLEKEKISDARLEAFKWLDAAAENGDILAKLKFGMQAEPYLRYPNIPADQKSWIQQRARTHLLDLAEQQVASASNMLAASLISGTLGKQSNTLAFALLVQSEQRGIAPSAALVATLEQQLTLAARQEAARLLTGGIGVLRSLILS